MALVLALCLTGCVGYPAEIVGYGPDPQEEWQRTWDDQVRQQQDWQQAWQRNWDDQQQYWADWQDQHQPRMEFDLGTGQPSMVV
jgi:hypothetical protein